MTSMSGSGQCRRSDPHNGGYVVYYTMQTGGVGARGHMHRSQFFGGGP